MDGFAAVDFGFAREVLQRGIAVLYVVAFVSSWNQFPALLGEKGLLPAPSLLSWVQSRARAEKSSVQTPPGRRRRPRGARARLNPTLFRFVGYTDRRLRVLCGVGVAIGAALALGIPQLGPAWVPMLCFLAIYLGYMSIVSLGQTFYGFGWEMLLLEAGFLAAFLGCRDQAPPTVVIVLFWWLVFRLEFGAGMIKIRGGREWRDLTALTYHHETQPMPGPLSRQAHLLPRWFHKGEVLGNHFAQLVVPWFLFAPILGLVVPGPWPAIVGDVAAAIVIATQLWLVVTGNFAWLNWTTVVLAFSAVSAPAPFFRSAGGLPLWWIVVTSAVFLLYVVLSWWPARNLLSRRQLMNASFNRWQLGNAYGAFGTVTKERIEIIVEGTLDRDPDAATWVEYSFKGKPGDVRRIAPQVAPYHLRLDWLMWFLPLGGWRRLDEPWFEAFLGALLSADAPVLKLLARDPFHGERPQLVRAVAYRYRFATHAEYRRDHVRWVRTRLGTVIGPARLR